MDDPIFIVGMSRSGTTLIARTLNRNESVYILNETHIIRELGEKLHNDSFFQLNNYDYLWKFLNQFLTIQKKDYYRKTSYQVYNAEANQIIKTYKKRSCNCANFIRTLFEHECKKRGKPWGGDQTPNHVFHLAAIITLFPNAKIINMVRDPRAVVYSQKKKWRAGRRNNQPTFEVIRTLINYHPITQALLWKKSIRAFLSARGKYSRANLHQVIFEDLVNEPDTIIRQVCDFLRIDYSPNMLDVAVSLSSSDISASDVKGINKNIASNWETHIGVTERFIIESICGTDAEHFGYKMIKQGPNYLVFLSYLVLFPLQSAAALFFNLNRIRNPFKFIEKLFSAQ